VRKVTQPHGCQTAVRIRECAYCRERRDLEVVHYPDLVEAFELDYKSYELMTPEPDESGREVPTFVFPEGTRIKGDAEKRTALTAVEAGAIPPERSVSPGPKTKRNAIARFLFR